MPRTLPLALCPPSARLTQLKVARVRVPGVFEARFEGVADGARALDDRGLVDEAVWTGNLLQGVAVHRFRVCCPGRETLSVQIALNPPKSKRN